MATTAEIAAKKKPTAARKPPPLWVDALMLLLAVVAVGLLAWYRFLPPDEATRHTLVKVDYAFCAVFLLEFLWQWHRDGWGLRSALTRWYDIVGLVPVTSFILRCFRLLRFIVVAVRISRGADAFADKVTAWFVRRFLGTIIDVIKRPITAAVLEEVGDVLRVGTYCDNIAAALEENHSEMDQMILEAVKNDPQTKPVRFIPFHDDIIRLIADTVFRMILKVLRDPRTDELVLDLLRNNVEQIRDAVKNHVAIPEERAAGEPPTEPVAAGRGR